MVNQRQTLFLVSDHHFGSALTPFVALKMALKMALQVALVPEPETHALLQAGLGVLSGVARRRVVPA